MILTLIAVIPFFLQNTQVYDTVLSNQVWLQTDQQFRRYSENTQILIIQALAVTLTLEHSEPIFLHGTLAYDVA